MIRNYLKVALRRFRLGGTHAVVNVLGLALGMATCSLIFLLVHHEWSYDRFHANLDRLHRVYLEYVSPEGEPGVQAMMPPDFTPSLKETFPAIEKATRYAGNDRDFRVDEELSRHQLVEVDPDFFEMFSFPAVAGDPVAAIADPVSMVVTTEAAEGLFGLRSNWSNALGRVVSIPNEDEVMDFRVGAVIEPMPENSSISFDVAISFENYDRLHVGGNNWGGRTSTYVFISQTADREALQASFPPFADIEFAEYVESMRGAGFIAESDDAYALRLQPLADMHRNMDVWIPYEASAHNPLYSWILTAIAGLILLIACINFMTLSVGQSTMRAREVGVRKVLGANRTQIMRQHWGESIVLAAVSLLFGGIAAALLLPAFSSLTETPLSITSVPPLLILFGIVLLVIIVGVVAGSYPAAVLSRFHPARVLKGSINSPRHGYLTRALVVLQFTISIGLIVATGIMTKQLRYMLDKDLGFEDDFVLAVEARGVARSEADGVLNYFRDTLLPYEGIAALSRAGYAFTRGSDRNTWQNANGVTRSAYNFGVGHDWFDVLGMEVVAGRTFSREFPADSTQSIVVNEALVREFEIESPVGHVLTNWLDSIYEESPTIIGVVRDFSFQSLHNDVQPTVMNLHPGYYSYLGAILIKVRPDNVPATIARIEQAWNDVLPGKPFTYSFVDDDLARQYATERRWQRIVTYSSILAILIACLGLFGLAILAVGRRTKEIGIRKVLGASVTGVATLVSREFAVLVLVAGVIASPLAFLAMRSWLSNFAFSVSISPWIFVGAILLTMAIALGTVGIHAVRAARENPVSALRYE